VKPGGAVGGARVFREKEKHGSSARVSRRNRWLNRAVKQLANGAIGVGKGERESCIGEKVEGRVKKVGLREVQLRDRGSSAIPFPYVRATRINCPDYFARRSRNFCYALREKSDEIVFRGWKEKIRSVYVISESKFITIEDI